LSNTFQSSINLHKKWEGTPFTLSTNLRHSQNTNNQIVNLTLPSITLNMNRLFPFKNKRVSSSKWYDKIGLSYTMNTKNEISIADSLLFKKNALSQFKNSLLIIDYLLSLGLPLTPVKNYLKSHPLPFLLNATLSSALFKL